MKYEPLSVYCVTCGQEVTAPTTAITTTTPITYCAACAQECHICRSKTMAICLPILYMILCLAAIFGIGVGFSYLLQVVHILESDPATIGYRFLIGFLAFCICVLFCLCVYAFIVQGFIACHHRIRQRQRRLLQVAITSIATT